MSLRNYLAKSNGPYEEILGSFHQEEIVQLYNQLKAEGGKFYFDYVKANLPDILQYISKAPSQREQKKWMKRDDLLLLRLAALQFSFATVKFLSDIQPIEEIVDCGSYRAFHSIFAESLANCLFGYPLIQFPFDGYPNPFLKNSPQHID